MACFKFAEHAALWGGDGGSRRMAFAEPGVKPHYGPSWTFQITHARVHLSFEPEARRYRGTSVFQFEALPTYTGSVRFDLDGVPVHTVTDGQGSPLAFRLDDEALVIESGSAREVHITYGDAVPRAGLYITGPTTVRPDRQHMVWTQCQDEDAHFFMPCLDHPRVKHPWTITLEGPADHTLLANGIQVDERVEDGRKIVVFEQELPMPAYLFVAVSGQFERVDDHHGDLPVRYFTPVEATLDVRDAMGRTPQMIACFEQWTGVDYPWPRYDQVVVHDFVFGGMENTACTLMTEVLLVDDRSQPHFDPDGLVSHELAHQWFGDLVTCQDWSQAWLNEAWATFMETIWVQHRDGPLDASWYAFEQMAAYLDEDGSRYRRAIASYDFREPLDLFDRHLYEKAGVVLRTLRSALGEGPFRAGVTHYLNTHAHRSVHGRDFQRALEDATGTNLDRFVRQWILSPGHPEINVTLSESDGQVWIEVCQTQEGEGVPSAYHLNLPIEIVGQDGTVHTHSLPLRARERVFGLPTPADGVASVAVDPDFSALGVVLLKGPNAWLAHSAKDPRPVLAVRALRALAKKNTPAAIASVLTALRTHPHHAPRCEAARLLGVRGGDDGLSALIEAFAAESEPRVGCALAAALGTFHRSESADALLGALKRGLPTWQLQGAVCKALGSTRDPRALDAIVPHLDVRCPNDTVRAQALLGIALCRDARALEQLDAVRATPLEDRSRSHLAKAYATWGEEHPQQRNEAVDAVLDLYTQEGFRTALACLDALGALGQSRVVPTLQLAHGSAPDGRVRRKAYEALHRLQLDESQGVAAMRTRLEALANEHQSLRARVDRLAGPSS